MAAGTTEREPLVEDDTSENLLHSPNHKSRYQVCIRLLERGRLILSPEILICLRRNELIPPFTCPQHAIERRRFGRIKFA